MTIFNVTKRHRHPFSMKVICTTLKVFSIQLNPQASLSLQIIYSKQTLVFIKALNYLCFNSNSSNLNTKAFQIQSLLELLIF